MENKKASRTDRLPHVQKAVKTFLGFFVWGILLFFYGY
jgi:hypothetical protein